MQGCGRQEREAGLARGTVYNNLDDPSSLLDTVCDLMAEEFLVSVRASFAEIDDPAQRISNAIRLCVRRVHEEPHWGRFIARYAMAEPKLGAFWGKTPAEELRRGLAAGRFDIAEDQIPSICAAMGGATFGALSQVLQGYRAWREAGGDTSELVLRGLGLSRREAHRLSHTPFESLPRLTAFSSV